MTLSDFIEELNIAIRQDGHDIYCNASTAEIIKRCLMKQKEGEKKGEWIRNDNGTYSCSLCHSWIPEEQHHYARFCLYCGENMRTKEMDCDYERAVEQLEHDVLYESTFNQDNGSM